MSSGPEPDTVTEAVALLRAEGYTADYELVDGVLRADLESASCAIDQAQVERLYRFEGPSDPGDEAIVIGVHCASCGRRGVLVSAFGPEADPAVFAHLVNLTPPPGVEPGPA